MQYIKGDIVIFERQYFQDVLVICIPILESESGYKLNADFGVGYSPERINPGDKINTLRKVKKLVSGSNDYYLEQCKKIKKLQLMLALKYVRVLNARLQRC